MEGRSGLDEVVDGACFDNCVDKLGYIVLL
jgi:hypothetical protein